MQPKSESTGSEVTEAFTIEHPLDYSTVEVDQIIKI